MMSILAQSSVELADLPDFRPFPRRAKYGKNGSDSPGHHRYDRTEECRGQSRFERTELVRGADEDVVHGGDSAAHFVGRDELYNRAANDHAHAVERAGDK